MPQVLRGCGQQHFVLCRAQASQAKPVELEDALHVRKSDLDSLQRECVSFKSAIDRFGSM
jgi:hypothetical protein